MSVDRTVKQVTVDHEEIPGFMGAMTMPYPVKDDRALVNLAAGTQITARLVVSDGAYWLEEIAVVKSGTPPAADKN